MAAECGIQTRRQWARAGLVLRLAWPSVAIFCLLSMRYLIDVWLVGKLGRDDLAAIGPVQIILTLYVTFGVGCLFMINPFVSQARGAGEYEECGRYTWQGIWFSLAYGILVLALWYAGPWIFGFFGHEPAVFARELRYYRVGIVSVVAQLAGFAVMSFFFGILRPVIPMLITIVALVLHTVVGYVFVLGEFGAPQLGIEGVGWALVVSSWVYALFLMAWFVFDRRLRRFGSRRFRISRRRLSEFIRVGFPVGTRDVFDSFVWSLLLIWLIGKVGTTVDLAATSILLAFEELLILPFDGIGTTVAALMGRALGRRNLERADRWRRLLWQILTIYGFLAGFVFFLMREPIFAAFSEDAEVARVGSSLAFFVWMSVTLYASYNTYDIALCAAGDNAWPTWANLLTTIIVFGVGGFVLIQFFPRLESHGAWALVIAAIGATSVCFWLRWKSGIWRRIELIQE